VGVLLLLLGFAVQAAPAIIDARNPWARAGMAAGSYGTTMPPAASHGGTPQPPPPPPTTQFRDSRRFAYRPARFGWRFAAGVRAAAADAVRPPVGSAPAAMTTTKPVAGRSRSAEGPRMVREAG
jgi:hypothetical protein